MIVEAPEQATFQGLEQKLEEVDISMIVGLPQIELDGESRSGMRVQEQKQPMMVD